MKSTEQDVILPTRTLPSTLEYLLQKTLPFCEDFTLEERGEIMESMVGGWENLAENRENFYPGGGQCKEGGKRSRKIRSVDVGQGGVQKSGPLTVISLKSEEQRKNMMAVSVESYQNEMDKVQFHARNKSIAEDEAEYDETTTCRDYSKDPTKIPTPTFITTNNTIKPTKSPTASPILTNSLSLQSKPSVNSLLKSNKASKHTASINIGKSSHRIVESSQVPPSAQSVLQLLRSCRSLRHAESNAVGVSNPSTTSHQREQSIFKSLIHRSRQNIHSPPQLTRQSIPATTTVPTTIVPTTTTRATPNTHPLRSLSPHSQSRKLISPLTNNHNSFIITRQHDISNMAGGDVHRGEMIKKILGNSRIR